MGSTLSVIWIFTGSPRYFPMPWKMSANSSTSSSIFLSLSFTSSGVLAIFSFSRSGFRQSLILLTSSRLPLGLICTMPSLSASCLPSRLVSLSSSLT